MFHFGSQILKEFYIVRGVRRAINSTKDLRAWAREQVMSLCTDATVSFRSKMRIEKVGRDGVGTAVSSLRQLGLGEEKMRFRGREVVFQIENYNKERKYCRNGCRKSQRRHQDIWSRHQVSDPSWAHFWSPSQIVTQRQCMLCTISIYFS